MNDLFEYIPIIGGLTVLLLSPIFLYLLLSIKNSLQDVMSFREWFMSAYDMNEKVLDAIDNLDQSVKREIFEVSLKFRDKFRFELKQAQNEISKMNKRELESYLSDILKKIQDDDSTA